MSVPIWEKLLLTIDEAAEYSGIGKNKLRQMVDSPCCQFVIYNGNKRMIKRKEFEKYISSYTSI